MKQHFQSGSPGHPVDHKRSMTIAVFDLSFGTLCLFLEVNMNQDLCLFFGLCEKQRERKDKDFGTNTAGLFSPSLLL